MLKVYQVIVFAIIHQVGEGMDIFKWKTPPLSILEYIFSPDLENLIIFSVANCYIALNNQNHFRSLMPSDVLLIYFCYDNIFQG